MSDNLKTELFVTVHKFQLKKRIHCIKKSPINCQNSYRCTVEHSKISLYIVCPTLICLFEKERQ